MMPVSDFIAMIDSIKNFDEMTQEQRELIQTVQKAISRLVIRNRFLLRGEIAK